MESVDPAEASAKPRQKRSRRGCLTCRTRRRKCDEGKPLCQNCILKGLECKYPASFQILGKNNYTPEVQSSGAYRELQFVSEYGDKSESDKIEHGTTQDTHPEGTPSPGVELVDPRLTSSENHQSVERLPDSQSPSARRYEYAIHGLLALGGANGGDFGGSEGNFEGAGLLNTDKAPLSRHISVSLNHFHGGSDLINAQDIQMTPNRQSWPSMSAASSVEVLQLTNESVLGYFKHYRYNIAPWLDICDMDQCFGCEVLQLSKFSSPIQHGILALAGASYSARHQMQDPDVHLSAQMHQQAHSSSEISHSALLTVLDTAKTIITNLSEFWTQDDSALGAQSMLEPLVLEINKSHNGSSLASRVYWLMARFQLSVALLDPSTVKIPLPAESLKKWDCVSVANSERIFRYAHNAVALCIDATIFSRGDEDRWLQQQYGLNRVELWKRLITGFERWYEHRPQDFQPVIELYPRDGAVSEDGFPTLVFSSGAASLANQLYHTGMLLLLQTKPRFIDRIDSQSPAMSALWHAHRTCGISLCNDRWDCWDPALVASLLVAAKTITHQSQHKAILRALESIQQLTFWNISHHVGQLTVEWQQVDGW